MNRISIFTLTLIAVSFGALHANGLGRLENIGMVKQPLTIPKDWLNAKKLLAEQPKLGNNVVIAYDMNAVAQEFASTVKTYLANNNALKGQELATELLRFFKIAFRVAEGNQNNNLVVSKAAEVEALTNKEGVALLAKARELRNEDLITALTQFGVK